MALKYLRSGAAGAATGADWANAYVLLTTALAGMAAGDTLYVAADHAETTAGALTHTSPGTEANPCFVICALHTGTVPPVSADLRTTATVTATSTAGTISWLGSAYYYGIIFSAGTGAGTAGPTIGGTAVAWNYFKNCAIRKGTTAASGFVTFGGVTAVIRQKVTLDNTTLQFGAVTDILAVRNCSFSWINTPSAITGAVFPTAMFGTLTNSQPTDVVWIEGVDLSALGSGKTIVGTNERPIRYVLKDCKLNAAVTVASTPNGPGGGVTYLVRSDSAGTNYRNEKYSYLGTETVETTIVLTGGASDGVTGLAKKIVTTANSKWVMPFEALPLAVWNDTSGAPRTVTLQGIWGGGAVPNNDDIWIVVEYPGDASSGMGAFVSSTKVDILAANAALAAGAGTWGGSTTKFKLEATFTPAQKGDIYIYVRAALASSTFYIDPKPALS